MSRENCYQCDGEGLIGVNNCPRCSGSGDEPKPARDDGNAQAWEDLRADGGLPESQGMSAEYLAWVIDNVYTIARRELRRHEAVAPLRPEMWAHVLRLCEQAGAQARTVGILRTAAAVDPSAADSGKPPTRDKVSD